MADTIPVETLNRARELAEAAGFPMRTQWGFPATDEQTSIVVRAVLANPGNPAAAVDAMFSGLARHGSCLAMSTDTPTDEAYELGIVEALRPLAEAVRRG